MGRCSFDLLSAIFNGKPHSFRDTEDENSALSLLFSGNFDKEFSKKIDDKVGNEPFGTSSSLAKLHIYSADENLSTEVIHQGKLQNRASALQGNLVHAFCVSFRRTNVCARSASTSLDTKASKEAPRVCAIAALASNRAWTAPFVRGEQ